MSAANKNTVSDNTVSANKYDESKIQTLEALEHIRLRSGMYIGRLGSGEHYEDGIYILLKEIIDNSIDEHIMGHGERIDISLAQHYDDGGKLQFTQDSDKENNREIGTAAEETAATASDLMSARKVVHGRVAVRDYGRGIPLGKIVEAVSVINTGAKYDDAVFQYSVGLNGVGTKAVNALSIHFLARAYRHGKMAEAVFAKGKLQGHSMAPTKEPDGTYIEFWPDEEIFGNFAFQLQFLQSRIFYYSCLNPGLLLSLDLEGERVDYCSSRGLQDLLRRELSSGTLYEIKRCESETELGLEFAFTHTQQIGESHFSFVNGQFTVNGGIHLQAFRDGFTRGINDFYKTSYTSQDIRDGLVAAIKVKLKNPIFESQTKNKLGNSDLRGPIAAQVRKMTGDLLYRNRDLAQKLGEKIKQNEKLRKELAGVRKMRSETNKRLALNIPQLRDCKYHRGEKKPKQADSKESMIFLTEGQSATGSLVSCRDVYHQALFSLRGKPWNCFGRSTAEIYQNEELYHLLKALGLENGPDKLRYDWIILATDADDDGYHIRNLLLTFFLHYFEELVQDEHLYILETPLFRVRNSKETHYCYNEAECQLRVKKLSQPEITRFKGLGEISPREFGQFIGPDMRLIPVHIQPFKLYAIPELLQFYMGKNTPQRKKFIIENLKEN